jgi:hypothetical protein
MPLLSLSQATFAASPAHMLPLLVLVVGALLPPVAAREVQVMLSAKNQGMCGKAFSSYLWIPRAVLPTLGMPTKTCGKDCGSIVIDDGTSKVPYNLNQINVADGHDVCNACNCDLAFLQLVKGERFQGGLHTGQYVTVSYSNRPGPPPPPAPPPGPPRPHPPPPPPPPSTVPSFQVGDMTIQLAEGTFTVESLNRSVAPGQKWAKANNFSFVGSRYNSARPGCQMLGDITIRVKPTASSGAGKIGAGGTDWAIYDSAFASRAAWTAVTNASTGPETLYAHDITALLDASTTGHTGYNNSLFDKVPLNVVRSYEKAPGGEGVVLKFDVTNTHTASLKLGSVGFPMPHAGMQKGIENSVWNDPHIGGDHGFVEWVRVVVDEDTLLATAEGNVSGFEAWRPLMESSCARDHWSWEVHSEAWAEEWKQNKQFPYLQMSEALATARSAIDNTTLM